MSTPTKKTKKVVKGEEEGEEEVAPAPKKEPAKKKTTKKVVAGEGGDEEEAAPAKPEPSEKKRM